MASVLAEVRGELEGLRASVQSAIASDEPFGIAHGNWSFPAISKHDLVAAVDGAMFLIDQLEALDVTTNSLEKLAALPKQIAFLRTQTVQNIWGDPRAGAPAFMITINAVRAALQGAVPATLDAKQALTDLKRLRTRIRTIESTASDLEIRSKNLAQYAEDIERAHDAADQLPTDLAALAEAKDKAAQALVNANADLAQVRRIKQDAMEIAASLEASSQLAGEVVKRADSAYTAATSQGLAAAFAERSNRLAFSMWIWVAGLVSALALGGIFGTNQLRQLTDLVKAPGTPAGLVALNLLLALLSVAAPVWFAWLATKQVGQRFRLSEDYAFKAAVSRSYEGFRREAARVDADLESSLLTSALSRLDEQPLRLVESDSHGSPWHELAKSGAVKQALRSVPNFAQAVMDLASKQLDGLASRVGKRAAGTEAATSTGPAEKP